MATERVEMLLKARDQISPVLNRNKGKFKEWSKAVRTGFMAITAAAGTVIVALAKIAANAAMFYDMADATGVSTDALQGLVYGIEQAGGSSRNLSMALRTQAKFVGYLQQGLATYTQYLGDLGITYDDLAGKSPEETFHILSEALIGVQDEVRRTEIGMVMFGGRGMSSIIAGLEQYNGSLRNAQTEFASLGAAMSEAEILQGKEFMNFLTDMKKRLQAVGAEGLLPLTPVVSDLLDVLMDFAEDVMPSLIPVLSSAVTILASIIPLIVALEPALKAAAWASNILAGTIEGVVGALTNYQTLQGDVIDSNKNLADSLADAVAQGFIPMEDALETLEAVADDTENTFGMMSDAWFEAKEAARALREEVATRLLTNLSELSEELQTKVRAGLLTASEAQEMYREETAAAIPVLQEYAASFPMLEAALMSAAELHITLADRVTGMWSKVTSMGRNLWGDFNTWLAEYTEETGDRMASSFDKTEAQIQAIMEGLETLGQIDLHDMQAFSEEIAAIHEKVLEMNPEQLREYFTTMTDEMREQYAEYLDWLSEAGNREAEAEEERQQKKQENSEKAMARITAEKSATLAAIEEAGRAQEAQNQRMLATYRELGESLFKVGIRGGEGMEEWGNKVRRIVEDLITSAVFSMFFNIISGGSFSSLSGLFGKGAGMAGGLKFPMGGSVPGGGFRTAQGGLTLPDYGPMGDNFFVRTGRGERIQPRDEVQRTKAEAIHNMLVAQAYGQRGGDINLISRNALLTEGEMARVTTAVRRA